VDEEQVRLIVRVTARLSAVAFLAALGWVAASRRSAPRHLHGAIRLFVAFLAIHTIHFSAVLALSLVTAGENIRERGGWAVVPVVAAAFYLSAFGILRTWRSAAALRPVSRASLAGAHLSVLFIGAIFLNSYLSRVATMPQYWLWAAAMVVTVAAYLARAHRVSAPRRRRGADRQVGPARA
jgi:hypothetical protein